MAREIVRHGDPGFRQTNRTGLARRRRMENRQQVGAFHGESWRLLPSTAQGHRIGLGTLRTNEILERFAAKRLDEPLHNVSIKQSEQITEAAGGRLNLTENGSPRLKLFFTADPPDQTSGLRIGVIVPDHGYPRSQLRIFRPTSRHVAVAVLLFVFEQRRKHFSPTSFTRFPYQANFLKPFRANFI